MAMGSQTTPEQLILAQTKAVAKCVSCLAPTTKRSILTSHIPVFRFGALSSAEAVTIGINPAENEPGYRRLPVLADFDRASRLELDDGDLVNISLQNDRYFAHDDRHNFFNSLERVAQSINKDWSYKSGTLAHTDVVRSE